MGGTIIRMSRCLRCLIVDDEEPARRVLRELLAADAGLEIVGEAAQVADARGLVERLNPDVIFLDVATARRDRL